MSEPREPMLLRDVLAAYCVENKMSAKCRENYARTIKLFGESLGKEEPWTTDLTAEAFAKFLERQERLAAPSTVYGRRMGLKLIWTFAAVLGAAEQPPRLRKAAKPKPNPIAWSPEEWRRVLAAADALKGFVRKERGKDTKILKSDYFGTLFRVAYDTGLRRGDLFQLRQQDIDDSGRLRIVQHKTSDAHRPVMRPLTLERVRQLRGTYPLKWPGNLASMYWWFAEIRRKAKVRQGGLHQTRRTGATMVVLQTNSTEQAAKYLGHKTPGMWQFYVDFAVADVRPVLPPDLEDDFV